MHNNTPIMSRFPWQLGMLVGWHSYCVSLELGRGRHLSFDTSVQHVLWDGLHCLCIHYAINDIFAQSIGGSIGLSAFGIPVIATAERRRIRSARARCLPTLIQGLRSDMGVLW